MRRNYLLSVYVDKDTYELLQEIAQREERPISYLVRKIIKEYLDNEKGEEKEVRTIEKVRSQETREEVKSEKPANKKPFSFVIDF